ncbi:MAG: DUF4012 domain-containing protein [Actinomycetota bacterium]|nr:DUF4012 domain-containing protein [Actinomycetota bacterium]
MENARSLVRSALDSATNTQGLVSRLPSLLGHASTRRYLLAFQALGEARATGGVIGLSGILEARDGHISLSHVGTLGRSIPATLDAPAAAPAWFQRNYGSQFATRQWQQVNLSPNFPVVSKVLLNMYHASTGRHLDGVIAMDPLALQDLLPATGSLRPKGKAAAITPDSVLRILLHDSYVRFPDPDAQTRFLSGIVRQFWRRVASGRIDAASFARGLARAVATQHVKWYATNQQDERSLAAVKATGSLNAYGRNMQMIFNNNYTANKVDYYLRRKIQTTITLSSSGDAVVRTSVTLHNYAPPGPPSPLLGPSIKGDKPGLNRMILNFLLPQSAHVTGLRSDNRKVFPLEFRDSGRPLAWTLVSLPPGSKKTETLSYRLPGAARMSDGSGSFQFVLFPQATVTASWCVLTIIPPRGWQATTQPGAVASSNGRIVLRGYLGAPRSVEVNLSAR